MNCCCMMKQQQGARCCQRSLELPFDDECICASRYDLAAIGTRSKQSTAFACLAGNQIDQ